MTIVQRLVVLVGQKKALFLAVRDWRRAPRHTALGGLLDATLRFEWARGRDPSVDVGAQDSGLAVEGLSAGTGAE